MYIGAPVPIMLVVMDVAASGTLTDVAGSPFVDTTSFALVSFVLASASRRPLPTSGGMISSYSIDFIGDPVLLDTLAHQVRTTSASPPPVAAAWQSFRVAAPEVSPW